MKLLLLGATGRTGKHVLNEALQRGHTVNVLVRDPKKLSSVDPRLMIFEGTPLDKESLDKSMKGCEAILSALNVSRFTDWPWSRLRSPEDILSNTVQRIMVLAPANDIQRYIFTSAWGVAETKKDIPGWFRWLIEHSNVRYPYLDHERQEELVKTSALQWTSLRLAGLTNSTKKQNVVISFNNDPKPGLTISRRSVAGFMLDVLEKNLYVCQSPVISARAI